jgi:hypothetical protein
VNPPSGTEEPEDGGEGRPDAPSTFGALAVQSERGVSALPFHGGGREAIPPPILAAMAGVRPYFTSST